MTDWVTAIATAFQALFTVAGLRFIYGQLKAQIQQQRQATVQLKLQGRQQQLELGNLYLARYWEIQDALLFARPRTRTYTRHRERYLRLCEDEYDAAAREWLAVDQWEAWHGWLITPESVLSIETDLSSADAGQFSLMRACLRQASAEGPYRRHRTSECASRSAPDLPRLA